MGLYIRAEILLQAVFPDFCRLSCSGPEQLGVRADIEVGNRIAGREDALQILGELSGASDGMGSYQRIQAPVTEEGFFLEICGGMQSRAAL